MKISVYLNGEFMPPEEAKVSVMDRGFLFADAVYEVVTVYNGRPFHLEQHLGRLAYSLQQAGIVCVKSQQEWLEIIHKLLEMTDSCQQQSIYIQVTRGVPTRRRYTETENLEPTVYVKCAPAIVKRHDDGIKTITVPETRWRRCDIKSTNLLATTMMQREAKQAGAMEAIIIDDNEVIEGSTSAVFIVKDGVIKTRPLSSQLLGGVTRSTALLIAKQKKIPAEEVVITEAELRDADEVWVTGSSKEVMPVIQVDDDIIGKGKPGPIWKKVITAYRQLVSDL
ncbi:MAG: aminotransferase class IV [Coxiellaceae bacterium]|nr:aminotransferase class IV [Coxiellaceae bacterium]